MWMPTFNMSEVLLQLKRGLDLCDFNFLVRFNLDRLHKVLIGTETMLCTRYSLLQKTTMALSLCFRMMEFVFAYTSELRTLAFRLFPRFQIEVLFDLLFSFWKFQEERYRKTETFIFRSLTGYFYIYFSF